MNKLHRVCIIVTAIAIANFLLFEVIAAVIGGDALQGKVVAGHYFLGNHGKLTEVSLPVFVYSQVHAYSLFVTHPLGMIAPIVYWITGGRRWPKTLR